MATCTWELSELKSEMQGVLKVLRSSMQAETALGLKMQQRQWCVSLVGYGE